MVCGNTYFISGQAHQNSNSASGKKHNKSAKWYRKDCKTKKSTLRIWEKSSNFAVPKRKGMFLIQNTLVSLDILDKDFCCDLDNCHGGCCIEGDAGAPVEPEEEQKINEILPGLLPDMTKEARAVVEAQGIAYNDQSGERVTSIVNGKDCVFARTDHYGWCYCLIEKAYNAGRIDFKKPISCHLYPIRLSRVGDMVGLEYHRWDICHCARQLGKKLHLPIYRFLKEPLIRRFGQQWYDELCLTATEWNKQCTQK